ncbi:MAG TPA: hypothetical protein VFE47_12995 [Tepidisphaeraceae bacterium]|jgi:hypothetical protein|nr:hypothetical protein [Tepidisphaeraceae bacterium]
MRDEYAIVSTSGAVMVWQGHEDPGGVRFNISNPKPVFMMSYAFPAVLGLVAPGAWVLASFLTRRKRRLMAGCCVACGYDLRATPERCPECGMAVKTPVAEN